MEEKVFNFVKKNKKARTSDISRFFKISRPTALFYLKNLINKNKIVRFENGPQTFYIDREQEGKLYEKGFLFWKVYKANGLKEYDVFEEVRALFLKRLDLRHSVENALSYAFTEMLNNVIDHSNSTRVKINVGIEKKMVYFIITDAGIGIFQNIKHKLHLLSELQALQEVTKGRVTTDPKKHTGEGIFFTSRIADLFVIKSHRLQYKVEQQGKNFIFSELKENKRGTEVFFSINLNREVKLSNFFRRYTDDNHRFSKTDVHLKLFDMYTHLVSRSQAKRVLSELEKFSKIILDFKGVKQIGQGFADEIFRVFQNEHSSILIHPVNMNMNVEFMVQRAKKAKLNQN